MNAIKACGVTNAMVAEGRGCRDRIGMKVKIFAVTSPLEQPGQRLYANAAHYKTKLQDRCKKAIVAEEAQRKGYHDKLHDPAKFTWDAFDRNYLEHEFRLQRRKADLRRQAEQESAHSQMIRSKSVGAAEDGKMRQTGKDDTNQESFLRLWVDGRTRQIKMQDRRDQLWATQESEMIMNSVHAHATGCGDAHERLFRNEKKVRENDDDMFSKFVLADGASDGGTPRNSPGKNVSKGPTPSQMSALASSSAKAKSKESTRSSSRATVNSQQ